MHGIIVIIMMYISQVRQDILNCGLMPKDIRLIRKKDTGNYCTVEAHKV